jgi:hypothetical protein
MLDWANGMLARTDVYADSKFKAGISTAIESILMKTGNYKGFGFLNNEDSETGTLGYYSRVYYTNHKLLK